MKTKAQLIFIFVICAFAGISCQPAAPDHPNIVWITAEDMSPILGYLGDAYSITPNIDQLATESVIYTHAFATSPVCSPSRAALINGVMASIQGAHQMRSALPLPEGWDGFPSVLRAAGYYTTNNVKTDYNSGRAEHIIAASWDENSDSAGWTGRTESQPFFSIFNLMVSHQSRAMVWPFEQFQQEVQSKLSPENIHTPEAAPVPPYYPDTPIIRQTIARFYDCVTVMDQQVGQILDDLKSQGLWDDTIVFFYSDHGSGLPRHKRALLDTGLHVPLLVRFPEKYKHLAPADAGTEVNRLVSFDDFGPTVLSLLNLDIPDYMQGIPFMGASEGPAREYVFAHRDRVDEAIDMARSVRDHQYHYVRNYMPHISYNQQTAWPDQGDVRHEFYAMDSENMTKVQRHFAGPNKAVEELYDSAQDPLHLNNLAENSAYQETLNRMRQALRDNLLQTRDLGFIPEIELETIAKNTTPFAWAQTEAYPLTNLIQAAEAVGTQDTQLLATLLQSDNAAVRYWGALGFASVSSLSPSDINVLNTALIDASAAVQIEAATALLKHGYADQALPVLIALLADEQETVVLYAARAIELGGEQSRPAYDAMQALNDKYAGVGSDPGLFISFATQGYLNRMDATRKSGAAFPRQ